MDYLKSREHQVSFRIVNTIYQKNPNEVKETQ